MFFELEEKVDKVYKNKNRKLIREPAKHFGITY